MNDASHPEGNFNVAAYPHAGRLSEICQAETNRDHRISKQYIEAGAHTKTQRPDKSVPSIALNVLVSVWESPESGSIGKNLSDTAAWPWQGGISPHVFRKSVGALIDAEATLEAVVAVLGHGGHVEGTMWGGGSGSGPVFDP